RRARRAPAHRRDDPAPSSQRRPRLDHPAHCAPAPWDRYRAGMRTAFRLLAVASAAFLVSDCTVAPASDSAAPESTVDSSAVPESSIVEPFEDMDAARSNAAAWCALVPPSLVASTLGMELNEPTASFSGEEVHCTYRPVEDGG